ncbi:uncharacterized protein [Diabrotica undecimpunctata]|uniref:uncharacterized protein n=1 Tax=Diabrotica undecimpunctata TaxID=50387 RepID=UPI003B6388DC
MAAISYISVTGTDIVELGLSEDIIVEDLSPTTNIEVSLLDAEEDILETTATSYCKDDTSIVVPRVIQTQKQEPMEYVAQHVETSVQKKTIKDKSSNLQSAAESYMTGQKQTAEILNKLLDTAPKSEGDNQFREKQLYLKEFELNIRLLEAKNKAKELQLKEREIIIKEQELNLEGLDIENDSFNKHFTMQL